MQTSINQQQTWRDATHGSRVRSGRPRHLSAPAAEQGRVHVHFAGNGRKAVVVATVRLVATGLTTSIRIALRAQPARIERSRAVPPRGGRVVSSASRLRQLASNSCRSAFARGPQGFRIQASFPEPMGQFAHLRLPSSFVASDVKQHSERANGTVLYSSGELPKASGDHQHEFGG